ncbi:hypothetical protein ACHAXN_007751 [Cyclotella atomus]
MSSTDEGSANPDLQKRYEEAMKRREMRHAQKQKVPTNKALLGSDVSKPNEKKFTATDPIDESTLDGNEQTKTKEVRYERPTLPSREIRDTNDSSSQTDSNRSNKKSRFQVYETYFEDDDSTDYQNEYTQTSSRNKPSCQWENYGSTSILFPPPSKANKPKAIIHFVGGTFFGSYPRKFYGKFLEDISAKCDAVIVATPIPLILPGKGLANRLGNWLFDDSLGDDDWDRPRRRSTEGDGELKNNPLDHLHLAKVVQREFNSAYRDVILDEYCHDFTSEEMEEFMKSVPIVGVGHSLGARIQAISCSHPETTKFLAMGKGRHLIRSGREGMVYLGFANWGASTSIPGVDTLEKTVRRRERSAQQVERNQRGVESREDVYENRGRRRNNELRRRYGRNYDRYSQYDAEDLDLADIFGDVLSGVAKGAKQIGNALTPDADDLEFKPSPDELWDAMASSREGYSSNCKNTLIVQFDEDPIDQGPRLARTLLKVSNNTELHDDDRHTNLVQDVKFARLKGGHLTPVSFRDGIAKLLPSKALAVLTSSSDYLVQQLGDETSKSSRRQQEELSDVVDTVASYIRDAI